MSDRHNQQSREASPTAHGPTRGHSSNHAYCVTTTRNFLKHMRYSEQKKIIAQSYGAGIFFDFLIEVVFDIVAGREFVFSEVVFSPLRVVTILTIWWWFYFKIGWRLPLLKKILFRIDLNGTWYGKYISHDYKNGDCFKGEITVRIVQDYLSTSLISKTQRSQNHSYSEEVRYDKKSKKHGIVYAYSQKEDGLFETGHRNGASELTIVQKNANSEYWLEGDFWTIHGTRGSMCVKRICKRHIDSFEEAKRVAEARCVS